MQDKLVRYQSQKEKRLEHDSVRDAYQAAAGRQMVIEEVEGDESPQGSNKRYPPRFCKSSIQAAKDVSANDID